MRDASNGWAEAPPEVTRVGVSLVLRDMGNGVTRVLRVACVEGGIPPPEFFETFGAVEVPIPLCDRVQDALAAAAFVGDYNPDRDYLGGVMRTLTDDITEFFLW